MDIFATVLFISEACTKSRRHTWDKTAQTLLTKHVTQKPNAFLALSDFSLFLCAFLYISCYLLFSFS